MVCELWDLTAADFAARIGATPETVSRWRRKRNEIFSKHLADIYNFAFDAGIRLNRIKE